MSVLRATPLILRFFLLALVVAAAVHFVFASDALRIGVFFTFVLTLSLFFPSTCGTVDKEAVDLIYYDTAMSVAAGLFLAKELERKRLELARQINSLAQQQHEVEAAIFSLISSFWLTFLATLREDDKKPSQALLDRGGPSGCVLCEQSA